MNQREFLGSLDELLELEPGTLTGSERLEDLENWNSMAMIGFIALASSNQPDVKLSARQIAGCTTVNDLLELARVEAPAR